MKRIGLGGLLMVAALSIPARAEPTASDTARAWLRSLRTGKSAAIAESMSLPFTYREAWPKKQCDRLVIDQKSLAEWVGCIRKKEDLLLGELKWEKENLTLESGQGKSPQKLRALTKDLGPGEWVHGWINGDGVTYEFLLLVDRTSGKPRVSACIIDASFDEG
jgi:hypothetical protein